MNCAEVSQKIEVFVLGELPKLEQVAIKAHLAVCPACRAAEGQYRLLVTQIKQASQPDSLRLDFVRAVHSAAKAEIQTIAHRSLIRRIIAITASAAACLLFASVIWHVWILEPDPLRSSSEEAQGTRHGGRISALGAPSILQVWQHRGALSVPGSMADGVVVRGQNMYLLQQYGQQAHVAALDIKTGRQNWLSDSQGCGHILADDSRVYCLAPSGTGKLDLVALDAADGKTLWKYPQQCPDPLRSPCRPTLLRAGRICWTTNTAVHTLSCANGELLWVHSIPDGGLLSAAALVNNDIYVANAGGLYCLNTATGDESWRLAYSDAESGRDRPLLAVADAEIYVSLGLGVGASRLLCMDLTAHRILWSRDVAHVTHLYAIGDMLYLRDQNVQALDRTTGQLLWTCPATGCNPVTYAEGLAYFVDSRDQGRLVALNRYTGSKVWELAGMKSCNAFIKTDGAGYVKTHDGVVHAIAFKG
jgi:outer membrane protein assembly factor BamB